MWMLPLLPWTVLFSADNPQPLPEIPPWAQWTSALGALALIVVGLLRGWLIPGRTHEREVSALQSRVATLDAEKADLNRELREQGQFMRDQLVPLATRTQDVLTKLLEERAWDQRAQRLREQRNPPT